MTSTLNGPLIRSLRTEQSISLNHAARLLGVSGTVLRRIESDDPYGGRGVNVHGLTTLAQVLGTDAQQLLRPGRKDQPESQASGNADCADLDSEVLAGVLLGLKRQTRIKAIAEALDWPVSRLMAAQHGLEQALTGTGIVITQRGDLLRFGSVHTGSADKTLNALNKSHGTTFGLPGTTARVLHRIVYGELANGRNSAHTNIAIGQLMVSGALDPVSLTPTPSAALLYALDV